MLVALIQRICSDKLRSEVAEPNNIAEAAAPAIHHRLRTSAASSTTSISASNC